MHFCDDGQAENSVCPLLFVSKENLDIFALFNIFDQPKGNGVCLNRHSG